MCYVCEREPEIEKYRFTIYAPKTNMYIKKVGEDYNKANKNT